MGMDVEVIKDLADICERVSTDLDSLYCQQLPDTSDTYIDFMFESPPDFSCFVMSLINLAVPVWRKVNCSKPLLVQFFCQIGENKTKQPISLQLKPDSKSCLKGYILKNNTCFQFKLHNIGIMLQETCPFKKVNNFQIEKFQYLFDAVTDVFPPMFSPNLRYVVTYKRYWNTYSYRIDSDYNEKDGIYICRKDQLEHFIGSHLFRCSYNIYISYIFVCDGKKDCPGDTSLDEAGCECNTTLKYTSQCKVIIKEPSQQDECSNFYFKSWDGLCKLYDNIDNQGLFGIQQSTYRHQWREQNQGKISCQSINSSVLNFYKISDICSYTLNEQSQVVPCNKGEHLQDCQQFECNMMFKCPDFYCIPWSYICDGKWDCPYGYDESIFNQCDNRTCINMFKCKMSSKCIHLNDVCNEQMDCPYKDDEYLCLLKDITCPSACQCLAFAVRCFNIEVLEYTMPIYLPYISVTMVYCTLFIDDKLKTMFQYVSFLSITNTNFENICGVVTFMKQVKILDISTNAISKLKTHCIKNKIALAVIKLNNNRIQMIEQFAFYNLTSLLFIDLSNNKLTIFLKYFMIKSEKLIFLSLENNTIEGAEGKDILDDLNLKFLGIEHFALCCFGTENIKCSVAKPWYMSCSHLLINNQWFLCVCFISFLILGINVLHALLQIKHMTKKYKAGAYDSIVNFICITDMMGAIPLFILWLGDIYFGDTFVFVEDQWKSSKLCFTSGGINLYYSLASPYLNILLSCARYQVTKNPLDSKFKQRDYVFKIILVGCLVIFFFVVSVVTLFWWSNERLSTRFCSLFFDPSRTHILVKYFALFIVGVYFISVFLDVMFNSKLVIEVTSVKNIQMVKSESKHTFQKPLVLQIIFITCSHLLCWMSVVLILSITTYKKIYPIEVILWTLTYVSPLNAILIPFNFIAKEILSYIGMKLK